MSRTAYFDIDTQMDFMVPAGALYVPGAEELLPRIGRLNRHAAAQGSPLISTTCAHDENDAEFTEWPPHCVRGCLGQQKHPSLLLEKRIVISTKPGLPDLGGAVQILVEKQELDCFSNPNLAPLLERLQVDRAIIYGVVTEFCVRCASLGLLSLGKQVELVTDAIEMLKAEDRDRFFAEFEQAGGVFTTVRAVCG